MQQSYLVVIDINSPNTCLSPTTLINLQKQPTMAYNISAYHYFYLPLICKEL